MYKTSRLLLVSIFAVVLMAPPAYPQNTNQRIDTLTTDVLNLSNAVKLMQTSADEKNAAIKAVLDQILARFGSIDSSVQKLGDSLTAIKASDEASARALQEARADVARIKASVDTLNQLNLGESLTNMGTQLGALKKQVTDLQNKEAPLPGAAEAFNNAYALYNQGFNDLAITAFKDFLRDFPKDPDRAPAAQLYLGNTYFAQKKLDQAQLEYELTIQNYPTSDRKCTALYKKGLTLVELKKNTEASTAFQAVGKECPGTDEAKLASDEQRKLPRGGRGN